MKDVGGDSRGDMTMDRRRDHPASHRQMVRERDGKLRSDLTSDADLMELKGRGRNDVDGISRKKP